MSNYINMYGILVGREGQVARLKSAVCVYAPRLILSATGDCEYTVRIKAGIGMYDKVCAVVVVVAWKRQKINNSRYYGIKPNQTLTGKVV